MTPSHEASCESYNGSGHRVTSPTVSVSAPLKRTGTLPAIPLADVPEPGPMRYRVDKVIPEHYPTLLYAAGGTGKSILGLYISVCVAAGIPFAGLEVIQGRVLYIDFELNQEAQSRRFHQISRGLDLEKNPPDLYYLNPGFQKNVPAKIQTLVPLLEKERYDFFVFDSLGAAMQGDMEAAKDIVPVFQQIRSLGTVLIVDHQSRVQGGQHYNRKEAFGSVYKHNLSRSVWQLSQKKPDTGEGLLLTLSHKKTNFGPLYDPIGLRATFGKNFNLVAAEVSQESERAADTARSRVKAALNTHSPVTVKMLKEITGYEESTIKNALSGLQADGYAREDGKSGKSKLWTNASNVLDPCLQKRTGTVGIQTV